ncbi:MAG: MerR family transcriptional regulator [Legionella sp.]|tara:strand:+ start:629 stop:1009 length:381 start_codon:yes stop_codon:yes gene_type:complete
MINKKIGEFAKMFGVGVETIRYYQRQGLLHVPENSGIRRYSDQDIQRLKFILAAKKAGFTLKEIKALLDCDANKDRAYIRQVSNERIAMLDKQMAELKEARDFLHQLVDECATTHSKKCPIINAFE